MFILKFSSLPPDWYLVLFDNLFPEIVLSWNLKLKLRMDQIYNVDHGFEKWNNDLEPEGTIPVQNWLTNYPFLPDSVGRNA